MANRLAQDFEYHLSHRLGFQREDDIKLPWEHNPVPVLGMGEAVLLNVGQGEGRFELALNGVAVDTRRGFACGTRDWYAGVRHETPP
jgi:hypothetical protein